MHQCSDRMIQRHGIPCTIKSRTPPLLTKCLIRLTTKSVAMMNLRQAEREGAMLSSSGLQSGEIITTTGRDFIIHFTIPDMAGPTIFYAAKINKHVTVKREIKTYDANGNLTGQSWDTIETDIPVYAGSRYSRMNQEDPGMVASHLYEIIMQPRDVRYLDRITFDNQDYQVDSIDTVSSPGNLLLYINKDTRA